MSEVARIEDQLRRAFEGDSASDGEAWHGPSLQRILSGVSAAEAAVRPLPGAHTIWEIALHIAAWEDVVRRRLEGHGIASLSDAEDWPPVYEAGSKAWDDVRRRFEEGHRRLRAAIAGLDDTRLNERVPEKDYTVYVMLHGVVQHDLYHAGQIALLKKAASRP